MDTLVSKHFGSPRICCRMSPETQDAIVTFFEDFFVDIFGIFLGIPHDATDSFATPVAGGQIQHRSNLPGIRIKKQKRWKSGGRIGRRWNMDMDHPNTPTQKC